MENIKNNKETDGKAILDFFILENNNKISIMINSRVTNPVIQQNIMNIFKDEELKSEFNFISQNIIRLIQDDNDEKVLLEKLKKLKLNSPHILSLKIKKGYSLNNRNELKIIPYFDINNNNISIIADDNASRKIKNFLMNNTSQFQDAISSVVDSIMNSILQLKR